MTGFWKIDCSKLWYSPKTLPKSWFVLFPFHCLIFWLLLSSFFQIFLASWSSSVANSHVVFVLYLQFSTNFHVNPLILSNFQYLCFMTSECTESVFLTNAITLVVCIPIGKNFLYFHDLQLIRPLWFWR